MPQPVPPLPATTQASRNMARWPGNQSAVRRNSLPYRKMPRQATVRTSCLQTPMAKVGWLPIRPTPLRPRHARHARRPPSQPPSASQPAARLGSGQATSHATAQAVAWPGGAGDRLKEPVWLKDRLETEPGQRPGSGSLSLDRRGEDPPGLRPVGSPFPKIRRNAPVGSKRSTGEWSGKLARPRAPLSDRNSERSSRGRYMEGFRAATWSRASRYMEARGAGRGCLDMPRFRPHATWPRPTPNLRRPIRDRPAGARRGACCRACAGRTRGS